MVFEEYLKTAVAAGKTYDELPDRVKAVVSAAEWKAQVRDYCIYHGYAWEKSNARTACSEQEYYDALVKAYKGWNRLYPYHLACYINRILRVSPFKYYIDILYQALREELSYDRLPNFSAADAVRLAGVGRNQYIDIMNQCKAKKLMWRMNKGIAKELLPQKPKELHLQPWWHVAVVNVSESEFAQLSAKEQELLRAATLEPAIGQPMKPPRVAEFDQDLLQQLHAKGLIWMEVPVEPDDRFVIPPLEGFVSNKTSQKGDAAVDPAEMMLYSVLMASSSRCTVSELAGILGVSLPQLQPVMSLACRLGFAQRVRKEEDEDVGDGSGSNAGTPLPDEPISPSATGPTSPVRQSSSSLGLSSFFGGVGAQKQAVASINKQGAAAAGSITAALSRQGSVPPTGLAAAAAGAAVGDSFLQALAQVNNQDAHDPLAHTLGEAVAVVVDAEVTSYLMMGAVSPGLKRHSVTLFEGGRISGDELIEELIAELWVTYTMGQQLEGELAQLTTLLAGLAVVLECARKPLTEGGGMKQLELLRKESLADLTPAAAAKMLAHSYEALLPIAPLPGPPLPLQLGRRPTYYGPTSLAASPWLQLAVTAAARSGPVSLVLLMGQRLWSLPEQLEGCSHALAWGWPQLEMQRAGAKCWWEQDAPLLVEAPFLLSTLNELLSQTAVLVQPILGQAAYCQHQAAAAVGNGSMGGAADIRQVSFSGDINNKASEERGSSSGGVADAGDPPSPAAPGEVSAPVPSWRTAVELQFVDVPLPLTPIGQAQQQLLLQEQQQQQRKSIDAGSCSGDGSGQTVTAEDTGADDKPATAAAATAAAEGTGAEDKPATAAAATAAAEGTGAEDKPATVAAATAAAEGTGTEDKPATAAAATAAAAGDGAAGGDGGADGGLHGPVLVQAVQCDDSSTCQVLLPPNLHSALQQLGLATCVGVIRLMRAGSKPITRKLPGRTSSSGTGPVRDRRASTASASGDDEGEFGEWLVIRILLGVPLSPLPLCRQVCQNLRDAGCLSPEGQAMQKCGQRQLRQHLLRLVWQYGSTGRMNGGGSTLVSTDAAATVAAGGEAGSGVKQGTNTTTTSSTSSGKPPGPAHEQLAVMGTLPAVNILFDGVQLQPVELQLQGTFNAAYNLWWSP